jgi:predicted  nucleic acid-binding Zn-ribbon protein
MEPEARGRFEKVDLKLSELDEKLFAHDKSLLAIRNLLSTGVRMLVDMETKMSALTDSQTRLYGTMRELAEAQKRTEESLRSLEEAQKRTEEALRRFLERSGNGHTP